MRKITLLLLPTASLTEDGTEPTGESAQGGSCLESPVFGVRRQKHCKFKSRLGYIVSSGQIYVHNETPELIKLKKKTVRE